MMLIFMFGCSNKKSDNKSEIKNKLILENEATIVTKNKKNEILQIIYFDFDDSKLSEVSKNTIKKFLTKNKEEINEYLIVGHTDTKGTKSYNLKLSIKRAEIVKNLLVENNIDLSKIKIVGKGEESLSIITPDDTKHPANRRVEIKKSN